MNVFVDIWGETPANQFKQVVAPLLHDLGAPGVRSEFSPGIKAENMRSLIPAIHQEGFQFMATLTGPGVLTSAPLWQQWLRNVVMTTEPAEYYEVWNEPNLQKWYLSPEDLATYTTIAGNLLPGSILGGAVLSSKAGAYEYVQVFLDCNPAMTMLALHPYSAEALQDIASGKYRTLLQSYGRGSMPIAVSEVGYNAASESSQALNTISALTICANAGVPLYGLYNLKGDKGLVTDHYVKRPVFNEVQQWIASHQPAPLPPTPPGDTITISMESLEGIALLALLALLIG